MKLGPLGIPMKPADDEPGTEAWSQLTDLDEWMAYKDISKIHSMTRIRIKPEEEGGGEGHEEEEIVNIGSPTFGDVPAASRKEDDGDQGGVALDGLLQIEDEAVVPQDRIVEQEEVLQQEVHSTSVNVQVNMLEQIPVEQTSADQDRCQQLQVDPEPSSSPSQQQQPEPEAMTPVHEEQEEPTMIQLDVEKEKEAILLDDGEPREEGEGDVDQPREEREEEQQPDYYLDQDQAGDEEVDPFLTTTDINRKSSIDLTSTLTLHQQQQHLLNKMQREELEERFLRIEAHFRAEQATRAATESQLALLQKEKDTLVEMISQLSSQLLSSSSSSSPAAAGATALSTRQQQRRGGGARQPHSQADTESSRLARAISLPPSAAAAGITEMERKRMEAELKKLADKAKNAEWTVKGVKAAVENALGTLAVGSSSSSCGGESSVLGTKKIPSSRPPFTTKSTTVKKVVERKPY